MIFFHLRPMCEYLLANSAIAFEGMLIELDGMLAQQLICILAK
jgi:hypothetical protein